MTWDRPLLPGVGWAQGRGYGQHGACARPQRTCSDPEVGTDAPPLHTRNTHGDTCWQPHTRTRAFCSLARLPHPWALIGVGTGHKGGQGDGWAQAGSGVGHLPVSPCRRPDPGSRPSASPSDTSSGGLCRSPSSSSELGRAGDSEGYGRHIRGM